MILKCPECGAPMKLRDSSYGPFYGCTSYPDCKATHGAHPDGKPLGIPANAEGKGWRHLAHAALDRLWEHDKRLRGRAYGYLRRKMEMTHEECHIGRFDIEQCKKVIEVCANLDEWDTFLATPQLPKKKKKKWYYSHKI